MIIIDMTQLRAGRTEREAREAVHNLFLPFVQQAEEPHSHAYSVVLVGNDTGHGHTLHEFEAVCPESDAPANVRAIVAGLREAADQFEAAYADVLAEDEPADVPAHVLRDLLLVVGVTASEEEIMAWTKEQRRQAEHWASATHMNASDNDVPVPARPGFLPEDQ